MRGAAQWILEQKRKRILTPNMSSVYNFKQYRTIVRISTELRKIMAKDELSNRQKKILEFIESFINAHGYPPTIREIGEAVGIASTSVVNYNLNKLVEAGHIARSPKVSRGLWLANQDSELPVGYADCLSSAPDSAGG